MNVAYVDRDLKNNTASITPSDKVGFPNKLVCGVGIWRYIIPKCSYLRMSPGYVSQTQTNFIEGQDLFVVNMHEGSDFVSVIREINPQAKIVALPDARLDETVVYSAGFWDQLNSADLVGVRTNYDVPYYSNMIYGPPVRWLPSPIGPNQYIAQAIQDYPRPEIPEFILAVGHRNTANVFANVYALKVAQNYSGLPVMIINPSVEMYVTAQRMKLKFEAYERCAYKKMLELIRRSAFGIDIMPVSSNHRHAMTYGALGVPLLVNKTSNMSDVFQSVDANSDELTGAVLSFTSRMVNREGFLYAEKDIQKRTLSLYGFSACRERIHKILKESVYAKPQSTHSL